jgi:DNA-binding transcriptional ArsR family regulator
MISPDELFDVAHERRLYSIARLNSQVEGQKMAVDVLSETFSALADPTRRAILARLALGEATVNELAAPFPVTLQAVSKHLKVLERAGLITRGKDAQWRPCRLRAAPLGDITHWLEDYRQFWEQSFDRLDEHLRQIQAKDEAKDEEGARHE